MIDFERISNAEFLLVLPNTILNVVLVASILWQEMMSSVGMSIPVFCLTSLLAVSV